MRFLLAALLLTAVAPAHAQTCTGDCDGGQSVSVGELVRAVNIALGAQPVGDCSRVDRSGNGAVTIDELVEAVSNAVTGCPSQRTARASSSVALSSVRSVIDFGRITAGGGAAAGGPRDPLRPTQGGGAGFGCQTFECFLSGEPTGLEEVCCDGERLEITRSGCAFDDGLGGAVELDGFVALESFEFDPCDGFVPFGTSFTAVFDGFTSTAVGPSGDFDFFAADYFEDFEGFGTSCFPESPDPLGFGVDGDGIRVIDGTLQRVMGDLDGPTVDTTLRASNLVLDVLLDEDSAGCLIDTDIEGEVETVDAITGEQALASYQDFFALETPDFDGSFLVDYEGSIGTDCLGTLDVFTEESLRVTTGFTCPTAGRVSVFVADEQVSHEFFYDSNGGVSFDIGADGTIDDVRASCDDLDLRECDFQETQGTCSPCSGNDDCGSGLECAPCQFCAAPFPFRQGGGTGLSADNRCVPRGEFAFCDDDIYGVFEVAVGF